MLNPESLWNSHWNPMHPVKVIIHGECEKEANVDDQIFICLISIVYNSPLQLRLWRRTQPVTFAQLERSLLHYWRLQHHHSGLRERCEGALSESNRVGAAFCESVHLTADSLHHTSSTWSVAGLYALHWLFSWRTH